MHRKFEEIFLSLKTIECMLMAIDCSKNKTIFTNAYRIRLRTTGNDWCLSTIEKAQFVKINMLIFKANLVEIHQE